MAVDRVPWAVSTQGVPHDAALARVATFLATGPKRGIVPAGSASGATLPTTTPSSSVRVMPMVAVAPNSYPGRFGESYALRNLSETLVPIRATGSGGGRSDVIIFRVDDPALGGGTVADVSTHDFARFQVVESVSASIVSATQLAAQHNLAFPFVWVARVTLPASTATVTASMIDASGRVQIGGQTETAVRTRSGDIGGRTLVSRTGESFPPVGGQHSLYVPEWATRMRIRAEWQGIQYKGGANTYGAFWVRYGTTDTTKPYFDSPSDASGTITDSWLLVDDVAVPEDMRGTTVPFHMWASLGSNAPASSVTIQPRSQTLLEVTFRETLQ